MKQEKKASVQEMKDALAGQVGSKMPVRITTLDGDVMIRYIRGFADAENDIVLVSETSFSLAMKILVVADIRVLEFAASNDGPWKMYRARGKRRGGIFAFL